MSSLSRLQAFLAEPRNVIVAGIRKDGRAVPPDETFAADLIADNRVLLAITPTSPPSTWTSVGLD